MLQNMITLLVNPKVMCMCSIGLMVFEIRPKLKYEDFHNNFYVRVDIPKPCVTKTPTIFLSSSHFLGIVAFILAAANVTCFQENQKLLQRRFAHISQQTDAQVGVVSSSRTQRSANIFV